jgi:hypothetical protein
MATSPVNQGYALPAMTPSVSTGAPILRQAAIDGTPGIHELSNKARSVIDQKDLPCCVSCALSSAMEVLDSSVPTLSPLFHYYVTRYDNGGANDEGFLNLDDGLGTLSNNGICSKALHSPPFTKAGAATKPSAEAYADALTRALGRRGVRLRYTLLGGPSMVVAIREELAQDHPVVIGIQLPVGYPGAFLNSRLEWLDPQNPPLSQSGHCVLAVGYNDIRTSVHIQDSRGSSVFDSGLWWMGYRIVDSGVVQEAYSLIP